MIVFPASRPPGESDLGVLQRVRAQARPNRYERHSQYRRYHDDGAVALTAVVLLSGPAFVVPELRAGAALLAMSVGGGVLSYLFWNAGIAKLGPALGHFHESGAGCFDGDCSLLRRTTKPRAVARWRAGDRRGDILSAVTWERRGGYAGESSRSRAATRWDLHRRRGERPYRNVTGVRMPAIVAA